MSFHSGRVTFTRFKVEGDAPKAADETALAILSEFAFTESDIGTPDEVESGWVTGEHIYDVNFDYEKNGFGDLLLFALRLDTNKPPTEIKHAYRQMQEAALIEQSENPTGFASRREKREAKESAERQLREDMAAGKFRKSKMIPVMWDLAGQTVYFGAAGQVAVEQLSARFQDSFNVSLEPISAGGFASHEMRAKGDGRDYEDLHPTPFTTAPPDASNADDAVPRDPAIPFVPWAANGIDMKDFLGNELLIWLWWVMENDEGMVTIPSPADHRTDDIAITIDKALDMECAWGVRGKQSLRADGPTRLVEAAEALASGKWPRKMQMILADIADGQQWELTWQGDRMIISSAKLPDVEEATSAREVLEQRLQLTRRLGQVVDGLMATFLQLRTSQGWGDKSQQIRSWIKQRRPARNQAAAEPSPANV